MDNLHGDLHVLNETHFMSSTRFPLVSSFRDFHFLSSRNMRSRELVLISVYKRA
jgi:hypothetical protein